MKCSMTMIVIAAGVVMALSPGPADAQRGGGGRGGGGHGGGHGGHGGGHHSGGHHGHHHGGHHGGWYGGVYYGVPLLWSWGYGWPYYYGAGYPYYPYPDGAWGPAAAPYVEPAPAPTSYWYYCTEPAGYYPYVSNCNVPWMSVVPTR